MIVAIFVFAICSNELVKRVYREEEKQRKLFLFLTGLAIVLYMGLRDASVGSDTLGYIEKYRWYAQYSLNQILNLYRTDLKDPTYYAVGWLFSRIFSEPQFWLCFVSAVYISGVMLLVYRRSPAPLFSVFLFLCLSYVEFCMSGMRQAFAMGITLFALYPMEKRKPIPFVLIVVLASLFHTSAIVFLAAYPMSKLKLGGKHLVIFLGSLILFFFFQDEVRQLVQNVFEANRLSGYAESETALNFTGYLIQVVIFLFCALTYPRVKACYEHADLYYNLSFIGLTFQLFSSMVAEAFRLSLYFSVVNIVLLTMALTVSDRKHRDLVTFTVMIVFLIYKFRAGLPEYQFFWQ